MPINYLQIQPQIQQYAREAQDLHARSERQLITALDLLRRGGRGHPHNRDDILRMLDKKPLSERCALPGAEAMDATFDEPALESDYCALAADGSQILPDVHEALAVALINISLMRYLPGSGRAPDVITLTRFLRDASGRIIMEPVAEEMINLERDVAELELMATTLADSPPPVVALRDGSLELFHEPRQGKAFDDAFRQYLGAMSAISRGGATLAGYIDRPRADLVVSMLAASTKEQETIDLGGLSDTRLFLEVLSPGQRSAIFKLRSPSSGHYPDELALHFFYINPGDAKHPWIARVEIPAWVAENAQRVNLLQRALLEQCRLMGARPYPYLLHRAHEEALVCMDEKEQIVARLAFELQRLGMEMAQPSHKLSAKELPARTRMKR